MKKGVQVGDSAFIIIDDTMIELTVVAIIEPTGNITNVNTSLIKGLLIINAFTDMSSYDYKILHFLIEKLQYNRILRKLSLSMISLNI